MPEISCVHWSNRPSIGERPDGIGRVRRVNPWLAALCLGLTLAGAAPRAAAETSQLRISRGFGVHYLPLHVIEAHALLDKHAAAAGLAPPKLEWLTIDGGNNINDAMLAGALDIATLGIPGFLALWAKTRGNPKSEIIGLGGAGGGALIMISRSPSMKTLRDVTEKDRIAVPGVKTSVAAMLLQMAVAKEFGDAEYARLDPYTVGLAYPEAVAAMLSGKSEITAHVASPPFSYMELAHPGFHKVFSSIDVAGRVSTIIAETSVQFRSANPKLTAAFIAALDEANKFIVANPREAAEIYVKLAKARTSPAEIERIIRDPETTFTLAPLGVMTFANFMHKVGIIKTKPASWKDTFVPEIHGEAGN